MDKDLYMQLYFYIIVGSKIYLHRAWLLFNVNTLYL